MRANVFVFCKAIALISTFNLRITKQYRNTGSLNNYATCAFYCAYQLLPFTNVRKAFAEILDGDCATRFIYEGAEQIMIHGIYSVAQKIELIRENLNHLWKQQVKYTQTWSNIQTN